MSFLVCRMRKGGILADDMGLGKTMQCSAFLAGALQRSRHGNALTPSSSSASSRSISSGAVRAMIVAPKTLLSHWEKELKVCGMGPRSHCFYGSSEGERAAALRAVTGRGGVLLTTYGMVLHNAAQLRAGLGAVARGEEKQYHTGYRMVMSGNGWVNSTALISTRLSRRLRSWNACVLRRADPT
jgi:hypothetical protein